MLKRFLRDLADRFDRLTLPLTSSSGLLASVHYLFLSRRFRREHRAVLAGRLAYERGLGTPLKSSPLLRRNIHRLEKGLVMQPRQPVFAEDYIEETVAELARLGLAGGLDPVEAKWAADVLADYFRVVAETAPIARARSLFDALTLPKDTGTEAAAIPRPREQGVKSSVSYDEFLALCHQRRSVRWFEQRPVPRELVLKAMDAAAQAPSACNRQPFLFRYFDRPEDARRIASVAMGTTGYAQNVPALVVLLGDLGCYPEERDRHVPYIDASLAAMQFMLALETLGLASCPINWPDIEYREREMAAALELPWHLRPVMLIALGYPDPRGGVPFSAKKPSASLLRTSNDYTP
ncbi:MAG: nitroreductase family protein [Gammaproteobacteria bacterium]|nr:nitroreductase family protein [Gammaproteobacteria bacterium]